MSSPGQVRFPYTAAVKSVSCTNEYLAIDNGQQTWGQIHLYLKAFKYFFQSISILPLIMKSICI